MEKIITTVLAILLVPVVLFLLYYVFVVSPILLYTEAQCLRQGYPKANVTVGLERYCMNLTGSVTVKVDHK